MYQKQSSKLKNFIICIIVVIIIAISFIVSKYNQYKILMNIVEETNKVSASGNYYYEVESSERGHTKLWVKGDYLKFQNVLAEGDSATYTDLKENKVYSVDNIQKEYAISIMVLKPGFTNFPNTLMLLRNGEEISAIDVALSIKELKTESIDNKECYKIVYEHDLGNEIIWVNKETLLPIKCQSENDFTAKYTITLNSVTDSDVLFDIDEYKLLEQ